MAHSYKILLVCDKNPCTSFGRLSLDIKRALEQVHLQTEILWLVTPKYFPHGISDSECFIAARSLYLGYFKFKREFPEILRQKRPDLILYIRPELGFLVPIGKRILSRALSLVMVHDTFAETLYPKSLKFFLINRFFIDATRQADSFLYNSEYTKAASEKYFGSPKIPGCVIGCPINTELFHQKEIVPNREVRTAFWETLGIENFKGVCLNVSLDEPRKNLDTFFKMAAKRPEVAFVRVGRLRRQTASRLQKMGLSNVFHFQGLSDERLVAFYKNADLFVYPSFLEGFGLPPLESIACGTSAVAAATSALAENLRGVIPLVSPADNVQDYIRYLDAALNGDRLIEKEAAAKVLLKFSMSAFSKRLEQYIVESLPLCKRND